MQADLPLPATSGVDKENIIAVVGDGSLSGGEAFEGLDFAATLRSNMIVIVNDNDMSIAPNEGGIYANLRLLRKSDGSAELNFSKPWALTTVMSVMATTSLPL